MERMVLSSGRVNRYGARLLPEGAVLDGYKQNPVLLWNHGSFQMSVGKVKDIRVEDGKLTGEPEFDMEDEYGKALARKYEKGYQNGCSIWFEPLETSEEPEFLEMGQTHATVTKWELLEVSMVNVQGDAGAHKLHMENTLNMGKSIPKLSRTKDEIMSLKKINTHLGLSEDASHEEAIEAIDSLKSRVVDAEKLRIDSLLEKGKRLGIINDENHKDWKRLAVADYDTTLSLINQQPEANKQQEEASDKGNKNTLAAAIKQAGNGEASEQETYSFEELSKSDPQRLYKIRKENPELYRKMALGREKKYDLSQETESEAQL